jgi:hypothetical protein
MINSKQFPHHPERTFAHSIEQEACCQFDWGLRIGPGIAYPEVTSTFQAFIALSATDDTVFHMF